ncbi:MULTISPECIES: response regulator transcription factor [Inquilinus]|uniref:FixJ family two-component response regulator n=1 Tax=Inquilinus ginsengisoli TaxID=363840 RepID=A0ABU1JHQ5_9PROT|nr:response regulator [Inquilinus ginsengisoli]MDR6288152.1 FixJ family two-component response regulator [Inquilinus ginsengisoli]
MIGPTSNRLAPPVPTTTLTHPRPTILVVDDDSAVRLSLGFLLETASFPVRLFASGQELLAASPLPESGCILIDYDMPGLGGMELLLQLRQRRVALPRILITGKLDDGIRRAAIAAEASAVLGKPFDSEDLIHAIHAALAPLSWPDT